MLVTDFGDSLPRWQVWDIGDRFLHETYLLPSLRHQYNYNRTQSRKLKIAQVYIVKTLISTRKASIIEQQMC